jgi:hypothetical protein
VHAKAITNGYFPFGAVMISDAVAEVFEERQDRRGAIGSWLHLFRPSGRRGGGAGLPGRDIERLKVHDNAAARGAELFAGTSGPGREIA